MSTKPLAQQVRYVEEGGAETSVQAKLNSVSSLVEQNKEELQSGLGSSFVGWVQSGIGAVVRWVQDKLREHVSISDFMTPAQIVDMKSGNPTINCVPFVEKAFESFGEKGGVVHIPNGCIPLFDTNLNIPNNCELRGSKGFFGRTDAPANMNLWAPRIIQNTSATIILNNSSAIRKFAIFAKNLTFYGTTAQREAQFLGRAITIAEGAADALVEDGIVLGFNTAVGTTNATNRIDRPRVSRLSIDCLNGVYLRNAYDVGYIKEIHGYPFVTLQSTPESNSAHLKRSGTFISLDGVNDWTKVTDCFSFGWAIGYKQNDADSITWLSCGADHPPGTTDGSIGYLIQGYSFESRIVAGQVAAKDNGVWINTQDENGRVTIDGLNVWETVNNAVVNERGDVTIVNSGLRNTGGVGNGIYATPTSTRTLADNVKMNGFAIGIKTDNNTTKVMHYNSDFTGTSVQLNSPYKASIPSNATLALDGQNENFEVTGSNSIQDIQPVSVYANKTVTLKFTGTATVNTAGNVIMPSNFDFTPNDVLQIYSDGTNWYQVTRSAN